MSYTMSRYFRSEENNRKIGERRIKMAYEAKDYGN